MASAAAIRLCWLTAAGTSRSHECNGDDEANIASWRRGATPRSGAPLLSGGDGSPREDCAPADCRWAQHAHQALCRASGPTAQLVEPDRRVDIVAKDRASQSGSGEAIENRRGLEVVFTKWLTDWPNMAGLVSGDAGGGLYAGEILAYDHTEAFDRIEALYHVRGSRRQFTARVTVVQNNNNGTARIRGVVISGAFTASAWGLPGHRAMPHHQHPIRRPS
jgi:hypothetical protein